MSSSASTKKRPRRLPGVARLLVPLLGIFFLVYPIQVVLASDPTPARISLALGGAALFVCVFLWLMWTHEPIRLVPAGPSEVFKYRATIAFLAILAGVLSFSLGPEWRMLFFYHINVAAGIMLPSRDAYATIAGIAVLTFVLGFPLGLAWLAVPAVALGLWATSFVGQVAAVAELRAAREELARLAVSEERLRFARDLHDLLGHSLSLITLKSELAGRLRARSAKSIPDGEASTPSSEGTRVEAGSARGGMGYSCSPLTRRGARLVASTTSPGQPSIRTATSGAASSRCSRLSSTSRRCLLLRWSTKDSSGVLPCASGAPNERKTVGTRSAVSEREASPTNAVPSGKFSAASRAASMARRVLPTPPIPVIVSSRAFR